MYWKYIVFFPGYLLLWACYVSPREWGKQRNVTKTARQWKHRDLLAPVYSIAIYIIIIILVIVEVGKALPA
jgi:hypothetical protein